METVFATSVNNSESNTILLLEKKIEDLTKQLQKTQLELEEKITTISAIENNLTSQYVEEWVVTDNNGKKASFGGIIYWMKGEGSIFYKDKSHFEGDWDSMGEIIDGKLFDYNYNVISEWKNGEEIEEEEEEEEEDEEDEDEDEDEEEDE